MGERLTAGHKAERHFFFFLLQACGLKGKIQLCREETSSKVCLFCSRKWLVEEYLSGKTFFFIKFIKVERSCENLIWFLISVKSKEKLKETIRKNTKHKKIGKYFFIAVK